MNDKPLHFLVRPTTIRWLWRGGITFLLALTLGDLLIHPHAYFGIDGTFGFNSWFGLLACALMVAVAKVLGIFLKREDTYYDD